MCELCGRGWERQGEQRRAPEFYAAGVGSTGKSNDLTPENCFPKVLQAFLCRVFPDGRISNWGPQNEGGFQKEAVKPLGRTSDNEVSRSIDPKRARHAMRQVTSEGCSTTQDPALRPKGALDFP